MILCYVCVYLLKCQEPLFAVIDPFERILLLWLQIAIDLQELNLRQSDRVLRKAGSCASEIMTVEMNNLRHHEQCPLQECAFEAEFYLLVPSVILRLSKLVA